jgi:5-methylcytosine-specific restriction endonuclease McrA
MKLKRKVSKMNLKQKIKDIIRGTAPNGAHRNSHWQAKEKQMVATKKMCEACGTKKHLEVHHILPFHRYPEKELVDTNLIVLCHRCHQMLGHGDNWKSFNPMVRADARQWQHRMSVIKEYA